MRTVAILLLAAGLGCNAIPPDSVLHADLTPEELNEAPGYHRMKGALLNDVRIWRQLDKIVDTEGRKEVPVVIKFNAGTPICANDEKEFEIYRLKEDLDRKSTRLNSSHSQISYAVFCLKKKKK